MHLTQDYRQLITYFFPPYIPHIRMAPSSQGKIRGKEQWEGEVTETYRSESGLRSRGTDWLPQIN